MIKRGFTIIELVIILAIIGILASYATLKSIGIVQETHEHAVAEAKNAFTSGVRAAHSQWRWQGNNTQEAISDFKDNSGNALYANDNGWPFRTIDTNDAEECMRIWQAVLPKGGRPTASTTPGITDYHVTYVNNVCTYTYEHANNLAITYNRNTGAITFYVGKSQNSASPLSYAEHVR
jgi:prepilin-type N-terminal cleavage/methylation domain-containing protein